MKRKLVIERAFLPRPDAFGILTALIKGSISSEKLHDAIRILFEKYPILNSHITVDEHNLAWLESNDNLAISLRTIEAGPDFDWTKEIIKEYGQPYALNTGPLVRFVHIKKKDQSILLINAYHLIVDGISIILLHDLLTLLNNPNQIIQAQIFPPLHELIPTPVKLTFSQKLLNLVAKIMWKRREKQGMKFTVKDYSKIHEKYCPILQKHLHIVPITLDETCTKALVTECKTHKVSVSSAISAAFLMADQEVLNYSRPYSSEILLPVNLRETLNLPPTAFGLYVSTIDLSLPYTKGTSFWGFAAECHQIIQNNMHTDKILNLLGRVLDIPEQIPDAAFFAKYGFVKDWFLTLCLKATKLDKINYAYSISNLGRIPFPLKYGDLEILEVHCHTYGEMAEKQLVITTVVNKMTIDISFLDSVIKPEDMERIRDIALKYLSSE